MSIEDTARAIAAHGWDCMSISEENLFSSDPHYRNTLIGLVQRYQQREELGSPCNAPADSLREPPQVISFHWSKEDIPYFAEIWINEQGKTAVIDIKQYERDAPVIDVGSHQVLAHKIFRFSTYEILKEQIASFLKFQDCFVDDGSYERAFQEFIRDLEKERSMNGKKPSERITARGAGTSPSRINSILQSLRQRIFFRPP